MSLHAMLVCTILLTKREFEWLGILVQEMKKRDEPRSWKWLIKNVHIYSQRMHNMLRLILDHNIPHKSKHLSLLGRKHTVTSGFE